MKRWGGLGAILCGTCASALMQTLVATSMPTIAQELGRKDLYGWVFGAYMLSSTLAIPLFAQISDLVGHRKLYLSGMALFLTGSILSAGAQGMPELIACRALQGVGAGAVAPAGLASIGILFQGSERGRAFGWAALVQVLANLAGPPLGGLLADAGLWRLGFWVSVPFSVMAMVLAWRTIPDERSGSLRSDGVDWTGALALGGALGAALLGVQELLGPHRTAGVVLLALAAPLFVWVAAWERRHPRPALPVALLRTSSGRNAALGAALLGAATNGAVVYLPLFLRERDGLDATGSGTALVPMLLATGLVSDGAGFLLSRGRQGMQAAGWILAAVGFFACPFLARTGVVVAGAMIGAGLGLQLPAYLIVMQSGAGKTGLASASGAVQLGRNAGGALCVPLMGDWLSLRAASGAGAFAGLFGGLATACAVGGLLALGTRESERAPPAGSED